MKDGSIDLVIELVRSQRTMVLATADPACWSAPVYYVYVRQRFYFFSSPKSRHVNAARESGRCAASIFRDSSDWRDIEGMQMDGKIERIPFGAEALGVFASYVQKFPTVRDFFANAVFDFGHFTTHFRTQLYAFVPEHVFYLNNQAGLGKRQEIQIPT